MKSKRAIRNFIILLIGIIIAVNLLADRFFLRLDFTADHRYTLSKATKNILKDLKDPVTVSAYFSTDLPPDIAKARKDFKELLIEYGAISKGKVVYEFIDPSGNADKEQKAQQAGIQPVMINVRGNDQMKQQKAYLGAVVQMGEKQDVIPLIQPGGAMEYTLSSSIKKLSVENKPAIGFLQGHGEPSLSKMQQASASLSVLYDAENFKLSDSTGIPAKYKTVAIIDPVDTFLPKDLKQLDDFLGRGGNLYIAYSRVKGDLSTGSGSGNTTGLETWLAGKGINIGNTFLIDAQCGNVGVRQGNFPFPVSVSFPYFPQINKFEDYPAVKGLEAVMLQFASAITYNGQPSIKFIPLAETSSKTGSQPCPTYFDVQKQWTTADFALGPQTVEAEFSGNLSGSATSNIILVSSGNFAVNGEGQQAQQLPADNINLLVNGIDALTDDTGLIDLRTKGVSSRPLHQIEAGTKVLLKYLNFLLPLLLVIIYGVGRMQVKRNQRRRRMEEHYV